MAPIVFYYFFSDEQQAIASNKIYVWNGKLVLYSDEKLQNAVGTINWINSNLNPGVNSNETIVTCIANITTPEGVIQYPYTKTGKLPVTTKSSYTAGYNSGAHVLIQREIFGNGVRKLTIKDL